MWLDELAVIKQTLLLDTPYVKGFLMSIQYFHKQT
jgi:hypothetical protein